MSQSQTDIESRVLNVVFFLKRQKFDLHEALIAKINVTKTILGTMQNLPIRGRCKRGRSTYVFFITNKRCADFFLGF